MKKTRIALVLTLAPAILAAQSATATTTATAAANDAPLVPDCGMITRAG